MKPTDFPWIPGLHNQTEFYTQRRSEAEAPANYKFRLSTLVNWILNIIGIQYLEIIITPPVTVWELEHNFGRRPIYKLIDDSGNILHGKEEYIDQNNEKVTFNVARSGRAILE